MSIERIVHIFPYIQTDKIIKMDDFEIHPYSEYDFSGELSLDEKSRLDGFANSFRKTFFKKGQFPEVAKDVGILKYKGTILRTKENSDDIQEKIKILFLLLKLHISHDFFNPGMNHVDVKTFDIFGFNVVGNFTSKFGNMSEFESIYTTIPENISGLSNVKFYPLNICINPIPIEFRTFSGGDEVFGIDVEILDITELYKGLLKDSYYYQKFLNIAHVYHGLGHQDNLFFYYSIIPSILEVLLQLDSTDIKKQKSVEYGIILDSKVIQNNKEIDTKVYTQKKKGVEKEVKKSLGLIARTFILIYDLRNDFLHEGKRSFDKLKVNFGGVDLRLYDIFQLIFKYSILNDFIEKGIIQDDFLRLEFEGSIFTTGKIKITSTKSKLVMDYELGALMQKAESDKLYGN